MTAPFVDFAELKARIRIEQVIPILGLTMKGGNQLRGPCPACKGDPRAMAINTDKQGFYCHARSKGGDLIALVAHVRGSSQREAGVFLQEHFGGGQVASPKAAVDAETALQPLDYLETDHEVIGLLGLTPEACEALGAGFAPKGTMAGRVLIPLRLPNGTLVGYCGIATRDDQEPLLLFPKNIAERAKPEPEKVPADKLRKLLRVVGQ
jgi:hypothetical protein